MVSCTSFCMARSSQGSGISYDFKDGDNQWLLIKGGEDLKPLSKKLDDTSALSGKSMKELSRGDRVWQSKEATKGKGARAHTEKSDQSRRAAGVRRTHEGKTRCGAATRQLGLRNQVRWMARPGAEGWKSGPAAVPE